MPVTGVGQIRIWTSGLDTKFAKNNGKLQNPCQGFRKCLFNIIAFQICLFMYIYIYCTPFILASGISQRMGFVKVKLVLWVTGFVWRLPIRLCSCCRGSHQNIHQIHYLKPFPVGMMTSSNGNIFRVTCPLFGEFSDHRWIPHTKASDADLWCCLWSAPE